MQAKLILENGQIFKGQNFGADKQKDGEVVFSTGMTGYPESLTDPSYKGQILVLTYPIIGNYGIPDKKDFESDGPKIEGLIVSTYVNTPSHYQSEMTLSAWLTAFNIPLLEIKDTRLITQILRTKGTSLGKISFDDNPSMAFFDPNLENLVEKVSVEKVKVIKGSKKNAKKILLLDCGVKRNIINSLTERGVEVIICPWNFDPFLKENISFDGLIISNGPGDPKIPNASIEIIKKALKLKIPTLGICLGHQLLCLAAGGNTKKLKFGHRSQNQPVLLTDSNRCYITTQNHGFALETLPAFFKPWFINANDNSNEGMMHEKLPFFSVQFHPEAAPGPQDTTWIFDYFLTKIK